MMTKIDKDDGDEEEEKMNKWDLKICFENKTQNICTFSVWNFSAFADKILVF